MSDDEQRAWLTYAEAGQVLGIKPSSAKRLSFRRHWLRRTGNDGHARVELPAAELHRVTGGATGDPTGDASGDRRKVDGDKPSIPAETLALELTGLRVQLAAREGELTGVREALRIVETGMREATQRADRADQAALDAWRTTADLARLLAQAEFTKPPTQTLAPRRGLLERWFRRSGEG